MLTGRFTKPKDRAKIKSAPNNNYPNCVEIAELRRSWPSARRGNTLKLNVNFRVFPRYVPRVSAINNLRSLLLYRLLLF